MLNRCPFCKNSGEYLVDDSTGEIEYTCIHCNNSFLEEWYDD